MSGTTCISSDLQTTDQQIYTGRGTLNAVTILTDGTNAATLTIYDNTSAAGTVLFKMIVPGASQSNHAEYNLAIRCTTGLYADVSGTGASYIVYYGA